MLGKWFKVYVRAPEGNGYTTPQAMKRVDDHLIELFFMLAYFVSPPPTNLPVQEIDGTWEVRVLDQDLLEPVKLILNNHYGLEIVKVVEND